MNALIVNCCGLGDGIIEIPFLKRLETTAPDVKYFHTGGILFQDEPFVKSLGLETYAGAVPARWRKFYQEDWQQILAFMDANRITVVINLRHIGPLYDSGYFDFKAQFGDDVTFLNYDFDRALRTPVNIRENIGALLRSKCLIDDSHDPQFLRRFVARDESPIPSHIAINVHTGSPFKRWPLGKWLALCEFLVTRGCTLTVFSGHTAEEQVVSAALVGELERDFPHRTILVSSTDIVAALAQLSRVECLVSTDSWPVHAATGIGVKTIGLYIVTSPRMWGGDPAYLFPVESRHLRRCDNFNVLLGICRNHYTTCPLIQEEGDGIEVPDVLALVGMCASGVGLGPRSGGGAA
jgi:ADP-heptose:LPS heptosyltransferase